MPSRKQLPRRSLFFLRCYRKAFTAGARSVVLSLWKVDDTATALLMVRFYQNLLGKRDGIKNPMAKAEALLKKNPNDVRALYALGISNATLASVMATPHRPQMGNRISPAADGMTKKSSREP